MKEKFLYCIDLCRDMAKIPKLLKKVEGALEETLGLPAPAPHHSRDTPQESPDTGRYFYLRKGTLHETTDMEGRPGKKVYPSDTLDDLGTHLRLVTGVRVEDVKYTTRQFGNVPPLGTGHPLQVVDCVMRKGASTIQAHLETYDEDKARLLREATSRTPLYVCGRYEFGDTFQIEDIGKAKDLGKAKPKSA